MTTAGLRVATICAGAPFLSTLVESCLDGSLGVPFDRGARDFSNAVIYVPTRRAARALAHAFADALQPRAVLLPRIVPLGDPGDLEERAILAEAAEIGAGADLPPAIAPLGRKLLLAQLVESWRRSEGLAELEQAGDGFTLGQGFADSFALAGELGRLIDEATIEGADWSRLSALVDGPFDEYWRQTRGFLEIAGKAWPDILKDRNVVDEAVRQNLMLRAEAERLKRRPPDHPVIAAGSTGTVPATADLLAAIARLPQGAVVLPGLDKTLEAPDWELVADDDGRAGGQPGHPQSALKRLLRRLGVARDDVRELGRLSPDLAARAAVSAAAALPADATDRWSVLRTATAQHLDGAIAGVAVIEAADEREEAAAVALALRAVLETPEGTAALITPDRALAERVAVELRRWGVRADDSAGTPFGRTPLGVLASLVLHAARERFSPSSVCAMLASPCLRGAGDAPLAEARAALEIAGLRGVDVRPGLAGLKSALEGAADRVADRHAGGPLRRVTPAALAAADDLAARLTEALSPLAEASGARLTLAEFAACHAAAMDALAGDRLAEGADGKALAGLFDALLVHGGATAATFADYCAVFAAEAEALVVPPAEPVQGRIKIWGLLEARLMEADRIVLGGLNEGVWPPQPRQDPFLNRAMRTALELAQPERRIGQSAHDFTQAFGAKEVVIARARSVEGTPMVASRFLRRLDAFSGDDSAKAMRLRGARFIREARRLDEDEALPAAERPNPKPPKELQPLSLSVTDVAILERDPYAIYARDVLGLDPLDPLEAGPDASDRGTMIHNALAKFVETASAAWPDDPLATLLAIGREEFEGLMDRESVAAFWWPMFEKAAAWFVEEAARRRPDVAQAYAEKGGKLPISLPDGAVFTLRGRGDLFERMADGTLAITDYKTGAMPGEKEVKAGNQPQLTLMAAMARAGGIGGVPAADVSAIRYVRIGAECRVRPIPFKADERSLHDTADLHLQRLRATIAALRAQETGYLSRRKLKLEKDHGAYDHLARVKEWLSAGGES